MYAEMVYANKFNENSDLSMMYLGQTKMTRDTKIKAEERFHITGQGFASGKLLDDTECQILLDTGAMKSYMSKLYYLRCKTLHALPKFSSNTLRIQVGNGQYISVLFVIPVIVDIHGHRFEIFTLVSKIHDNMDLVMGMKNIFELEGVINSQDSCFSFLSRSILFLPSVDSRDCANITKGSHNRSSFHQRTIRYGHGKKFRHERANHKHDKIEIHLKQSSFEDYEQIPQDCDFW